MPRIIIGCIIIEIFVLIAKEEKQIDEQNKNVAVFVENERSYVSIRL